MATKPAPKLAPKQPKKTPPDSIKIKTLPDYPLHLYNIPK